MAKDICELITTLNDHLTQKIIVLAEEGMVREGQGSLQFLIPGSPWAVKDVANRH